MRFANVELIWPNPLFLALACISVSSTLVRNRLPLSLLLLFKDRELRVCVRYLLFIARASLTTESGTDCAMRALNIPFLPRRMISIARSNSLELNSVFFVDIGWSGQCQNGAGAFACPGVCDFES